MVADPVLGRNFGFGASIVSQGHHVVGTSASKILYNFRQRGPAWTAEATNSIITPAPLPTSKLGYAIDIDGDTAVVGAKDYDGRGAAFVYRYDAGSNLWNFEAKLQAEGIRLGDDYGTSVSVSGDTVVVGATDAQGGAGAAYVYQRLGNAWSETATLTGGVNGMDFGRAVDVDVDTIAVGSTDELGGAASAGRVHFFRLGVSGWQQTQTVIGSTAGFGSALGLDNTSLVVGAPDTANGDGAAEVYLF
ncbi:MAG: FG-GAP repeat protein, partial [Pirellulaceae bacterium]